MSWYPTYNLIAIMVVYFFVLILNATRKEIVKVTQSMTEYLSAISVSFEWYNTAFVGSQMSHF